MMPESGKPLAAYVNAFIARPTDISCKQSLLAFLNKKKGEKTLLREIDKLTNAQLKNLLASIVTLLGNGDITIDETNSNDLGNILSKLFFDKLITEEKVNNETLDACILFRFEKKLSYPNPKIIEFFYKKTMLSILRAIIEDQEVDSTLVGIMLRVQPDVLKSILSKRKPETLAKLLSYATHHNLTEFIKLLNHEEVSSSLEKTEKEASPPKETLENWQARIFQSLQDSTLKNIKSLKKELSNPPHEISTAFLKKVTSEIKYLHPTLYGLLFQKNLNSEDKYQLLKEILDEQHGSLNVCGRVVAIFQDKTFKEYAQGQLLLEGNLTSKKLNYLAAACDPDFFKKVPNYEQYLAIKEAGFTPFMRAAFYGNSALVSYYLTNHRELLTKKDIEEGLYYSALNQNQEVTQLLVDAQPESILSLQFIGGSNDSKIRNLKIIDTILGSIHEAFNPQSISLHKRIFKKLFDVLVKNIPEASEWRSLGSSDIHNLLQTIHTFESLNQEQNFFLDLLFSTLGYRREPSYAYKLLHVNGDIDLQIFQAFSLRLTRAEIVDLFENLGNYSLTRQKLIITVALKSIDSGVRLYSWDIDRILKINNLPTEVRSFLTTRSSAKSNSPASAIQAPLTGEGILLKRGAISSPIPPTEITPSSRETERSTTISPSVARLLGHNRATASTPLEPLKAYLSKRVSNINYFFQGSSQKRKVVQGFDIATNTIKIVPDGDCFYDSVLVALILSKPASKELCTMTNASLRKIVSEKLQLGREYDKDQFIFGNIATVVVDDFLAGSSHFYDGIMEAPFKEALEDCRAEHSAAETPEAKDAIKYTMIAMISQMPEEEQYALYSKKALKPHGFASGVIEATILAKELGVSIVIKQDRADDLRFSLDPNPVNGITIKYNGIDHYDVTVSRERISEIMSTPTRSAAAFR